MESIVVACTTSCKARTCRTYGECLRNKKLQVEGVEAHRFNQSQRHAIDEYVDARREGMQPEGIKPKQVAFARKMTDLTGTPFRADAE